MQKPTDNRKAGGLAALLLLGIFAVCIFSVLMAGGKIYRQVTENGAAVFEGRTGSQFIAMKVRQAPAAALSVRDFGGGDALVITEEIDGEKYLTRVYCHDGWLRELFSEEGTALTPWDGEKILPMDELRLALDHGLLTTTLVSASGISEDQILFLRGEGGLAP